MPDDELFTLSVGDVKPSATSARSLFANKFLRGPFSA